MKTLKEYAEQLKGNIANPATLSDIMAEAAADYAYLTEQYTNLQIAKAKIWTDIKTKTRNGKNLINREKPLSDTLTEQIWFQSDPGQRELKIKYKLKALEKIITSCKSVIYGKEREYRDS